MMYSPLKMSGKKREENYLLWAIVIILTGTSILTATHTIFRGVQLDLLQEEVRELSLQLRQLQDQEDKVEVELQRTRRQVDLFSRPEVLDYAYNARLPDSDSNLSVYDKWFTNNQPSSDGLSSHHKISASWTGEDEEVEDLAGEVLYQDDDAYRNSQHRSSRVAGNAGETYRPQQGYFVEVQGRLTDRGQPSTPSPIPSTSTRRYLRPQVKSLGTPDQPTKTSTAIQLEAAPGPGNEITWTLARWALRMKSDSSFPVSAAGVGVPSPGLYLAYAQITYLDKHKQQGFSILVNDNVAIECQENRGVSMEMMCQTAGLLYLEQGDKVSIKDLIADRKKDIGHGKTFFGLVKLTADWI